MAETRAEAQTEPQTRTAKERLMKQRFGHAGTRAAAAASVLTLVLNLGMAMPAGAQVKTFKFGTAGNWKVLAVYTRNRVFSHCTAQARYKNGMKIFLIAYANQVWSLQFHRPDWPRRDGQQFPVTLKVDGRTVMTTDGKFRGRSAFISLGSSSKRVRAIMRGRVMAVVSPSGTSRFKLTGTNRAARMVGRCWKRHQTIATSRNDGAFGAPPGGNNQGAFGAPPSGSAKPPGAFRAPRQSPPTTRRRKSRALLTREQTMKLAIRYLSGVKAPYEILASDRNVFRNFPVNWRYETGRLGGMMVLKESRFNAEMGLQSLLRDHAKWCKGRSQVDRKPTRGVAGAKVARARGLCRTQGKVIGYDYSVAELKGRRVMLIIESLPTRSVRPGARASDRSGYPSNEQTSRNSGTKNTLPPLGTQRRQRAVGPDEL